MWDLAPGPLVHTAERADEALRAYLQSGQIHRWCGLWPMMGLRASRFLRRSKGASDDPKRCVCEGSSCLNNRRVGCAVCQLLKSSSSCWLLTESTSWWLLTESSSWWLHKELSPCWLLKESSSGWLLKERRVVPLSLNIDLSGSLRRYCLLRNYATRAKLSTSLHTFLEQGTDKTVTALGCLLLILLVHNGFGHCDFWRPGQMYFTAYHERETQPAHLYSIHIFSPRIRRGFKHLDSLAAFYLDHSSLYI